MLHPYFLWNEWKRGPEKFDTVNMLSREKWSKNLWKPAILPIKTLSRQNFGSTSSDLDVFSVSDTLNWYSSSRVFVLLTSVVVSLVVSIKSLNYIRSTTTTRFCWHPNYRSCCVAVRRRWRAARVEACLVCFRSERAFEEHVKNRSDACFYEEMRKKCVFVVKYIWCANSF